MREFETFKRRMVPLVKTPYVTVQKRGTMSFNKAAHDALGSPEAVELLFDKTNHVMGIRPIDPSATHAYPMRAQANKAEGPFIVSGSAFMKYYGIKTVEARRFRAEMEDGVLIIDLSSGGEVVTSNRSGSASTDGDEAAT